MMPPPKEIPVKLRNAYTMNRRARVKILYYDSTYGSETPKVYTRATIDKYIGKAKARQNFYYKKTDACLYKALGRHSIERRSVAVMGSTDPWYEAVALAYGGWPTTIEYNKIISEDPRLAVTTNAEFAKKPRQFDAAFSISSFEHDGLGRYGDPLDPDGDVHTMATMKTIVKPSGLLFLALPVGQDTVVWNAHRVYGSHRLPRLLAQWKIVDFFGVRPGYFQPVIVLQNVDSTNLSFADRWRRWWFYESVRYMELAETLVSLVTGVLVALVGKNTTYKLKEFIHSRL